MAVPNRYNGGGPLAGVVLVDATTGDPYVAAAGTPPAQGSATAGQTGGLVQGAATTNAPTYATGTTNPVSLDTSGRLRSLVKADSYTQLGYQQITAATLASSTGLTVPGGATTAIIQNNTTQIARFRPDGATTAPTTTTGQRLAVAGTLTLDIGNAGLTSSRFILEAAGTGNFDITYYS